MDYWQLDEDDTIHATDEADMCHDGWRDDPVWRVVGEACPHMVGKHPSDPRCPAHTRYRRPIVEARSHVTQQAAAQHADPSHGAA